LLLVPDSKFDITDPEFGACLERLQRAGSYDSAIDRRAVGRTQVFDVQGIVREDQSRVNAGAF
jgi:hypothetical protein